MPATRDLAAFRLHAHEPAYLRTHATGELTARAGRALDQLHACCTCPRASGVDRFEQINRRPTQAELKRAYAAAEKAGIWRLD